MTSIREGDDEREAIFCDECGGRTISSCGETVCIDCGIILEKTRTFGIEFRESKEYPSIPKSIRDHSEIGSRPSFVGGLGSYIGFRKNFFFRDMKGKPLPPKKQHLFAHLKAVYNSQNRIRGQETVYRCLCSLQRVVEILRLPKSISRRAAYLFRKAIARQKRIRGTTSLILMGYCLLLATREFDRSMPSRAEDIARAFQNLGHRVTTKALMRVGSEYRDLSVLGRKPVQAEEYLGRIMNKVIADKRVLGKLRQHTIEPLQYQQKMIAICGRLLERINGAERGGRNPYIFAASTIYAVERSLAKKEKRRSLLTQKIVAEITDVAEYSIRDHFCSVLKKHSRSLQVHEQTTPSHSAVSSPPEKVPKSQRKAILISRRR